jgi:hypothetical protein
MFFVGLILVSQANFPRFPRVIAGQFADQPAAGTSAQQSDQGLETRIMLEGGWKT